MLVSKTIETNADQKYAVVGYQIENSKGLAIFFQAFRTKTEAESFCEYLSEHVKIPGLMLVNACEPCEVRSNLEGNVEHHPIIATRALMQQHAQDMEWFHPSYQVRTNARLLKMLKERSAGGKHQHTSFLIAQIAEWHDEIDQLQGLVRDLVNKSERNHKMLEKADLLQWQINEEEQSILKEHLEAQDFQKIQDEVSRMISSGTEDSAGSHHTKKQKKELTKEIEITN